MTLVCRDATETCVLTQMMTKMFVVGGHVGENLYLMVEVRGPLLRRWENGLDSTRTGTA